MLSRSIDLVWGDLASLAVVDGAIDLGEVEQIACGSTGAGYALDNLMPDPGHVDFYLARESGASDYGQSTAGEPRQASALDCP